MKKRLSIIVPVYKVEPYIERCIRSLEHQNILHSEYEIICINDGSPDKSREVVIKMQKEYTNIILIDQENQGVSVARNNGIDMATGKYILMIDPDDYVVTDTFSAVLDYADKYKAEVTFLGYRVLFNDGSIKTEILNENEKGKLFSGITASWLSRGDGKTDPDRMWAVLFDRDFMQRNNLSFLPNVPYLEDGELIARILCIAKRCVFFGELFYIRTTRQESATNSDLFYTRRAMEGFVKCAKNIHEFRESGNFNLEQQGYLNGKIIKFIVLSFSSVMRVRNMHRIIYLRRQIRENKLFNINLDRVPISYLEYGNKINKSFLSIIVFLFIKRLKDKIILMWSN